MALSANTAWEVRTAGNDTNGGGFVAGASGTDYSQQNSKNTVGSDISITDGVANGSTTFTSATANFSTAIVGNLVYFSGGTGSITGTWRQVTARASTTSITLDASIAASTGMTANIGGALLTISQGMTNMIASNKIFVKNDGTYTITASITMSKGVLAQFGIPGSALIGYTTTRGDNGRPTVSLSTNTGLTGLNVTTAQGWQIWNFIINCNSLGTSIGIGSNQSFVVCRNVKVQNFTSKGINFGANQCLAYDCEVTGGTSAATFGIVTAAPGGLLIRCNVHDNACPGINAASAGVFVCQSLIANNTGASSDGIQVTNNVTLLSNTIYGNGRHGISNTQAWMLCNQWKNNIIVNNGGFGIKGASSAGNPADPGYDGNAYYNNTSGSRSNMDDAGSVNAINAAAPYTNTLDVTLTADPFTNAAGNDFSLNNTVGGGASCRGHGYPGALPAGLTTGYLDMGPAQHQDISYPFPFIGSGSFAIQ